MGAKMEKIALIGAGKVGKTLALAFQRAGFNPSIFVRQLSAQYRIFSQENNLRVDVLDNMDKDADLYLICVSDKNIPEVAASLAAQHLQKNAIIAHTAGGQSLEKLTNLWENSGVFYPLQTFSEGRKVDFQQLPFCINGANQTVIDSLCDLAKSIGNGVNVRVISEEERAKLHVGAVFVNNFTNYLFAVAQQFCQQESIDFNLLLPLMQETVDKVKDNPLNISQLQTGAAARGDLNTIAKHSELLQKYPQWANLYQFLTEQILAFYQK